MYNFKTHEPTYIIPTLTNQETLYYCIIYKSPPNGPDDMVNPTSLKASHVQHGGLSQPRSAKPWLGAEADRTLQHFEDSTDKFSNILIHLISFNVRTLVSNIDIMLAIPKLITHSLGVFFLIPFFPVLFGSFQPRAPKL